VAAAGVYRWVPQVHRVREGMPKTRSPVDIGSWILGIGQVLAAARGDVEHEGILFSRLYIEHDGQGF
jgi:hypothetical protein